MHLGWGVLKKYPSSHYFSDFSPVSNHWLAIEYHIHIWQVSLQLSSNDTCQIWKRFKELNRYFCNITNFLDEDINEQSFSNPHPCYICKLMFWILWKGSHVGQYIIHGVRKLLNLQASVPDGPPFYLDLSLWIWERLIKFPKRHMYIIWHIDNNITGIMFGLLPYFVYMIFVMRTRSRICL